MNIISKLFTEAAGILVGWFGVATVCIGLIWVWSWGAPWSYLMWLPVLYFIYWYIRETFSTETRPYVREELTQDELEHMELDRRHDEYRRSKGIDVDAENEAIFNESMDRIRRGR